MNTARLFVTAWLALCALQVFAVEIAPGLTYLRPGTAVTPVKGSAVLDLRALPDEAAATPLLAAVEPGETNPRRVVLVLVSPETPAGLRNQITGRSRWLTVGRLAPNFKTDLAVTTTAEAEKSALEALAAGVSPEKLIVENADKPRFDETALVREHAGAPASPEAAETPASPAPPNASTPEKTPAALVDAVLQRAVQVHRGLVTLRRT